jgi:nucleoside-diphosphate-sugar epimerase
MQEYRANGFPFTVVRPSFTYGVTLVPAAITSWVSSYALIDRMKKGKKIIVHGDGTSLWQMTHNTDFAKGLVGLLCNPKTVAHAFHITTDEVLSWNQIYEIIGEAAGVKPNLIHIPTDFIKILNPSEEGNLDGDKSPSKVFDNAKIKAFVPGFAATTLFADGVRQSLEWLEARPELCVEDKRWDDMCDKIIAAYETGVKAAYDAAKEQI